MIIRAGRRPWRGTAPAVTALVILVLSLGGVPVASAITRDEARAAQTEGRWDDAVELWRALAQQSLSGAAPDTVRVAYLRVLETTGRYARLEDEARAALKENPEWPPAAMALARALEARGRLEQAIGVLRDAGRTGAPWGKGLRTRATAMELARLLREAGKRDEAAGLAHEVMESYDPAETYSPQALVAVGDAARMRGAFQDAVRMYQTAYEIDPGFLRARLALADLFQEKYQAKLAADELAAAGKIAPRHPDVLLAAARLALRNNQLARAEAAARAVQRIRPEDPGAARVLARLACIADDPERARALLLPVLKRNSADLAARSLLAAAAYLAGDSTAYRSETAKVLKQDPGYLDVYLDLGSLLEMSRRNDEALEVYRRVLALDPDNARALSQTGLVIMREGEETKAREYLEKGFQQDRFNLRVYNQLELLDKLDTFGRYVTDHFEIRLEADKDSVLVPLLESRLARIYDDLVALHGWKPRVRTVVEVYPSHDWFSARVTGFPRVEGIPAVCFGDVVAMDSPRILAGRSNWERILRHEFGHVLALGMSHKKVPFWFTEGLSVYLERYPRSMRWDQTLKAAWVDGTLVPVDSLTLAFTRPRDLNQRLLAYYEASLVIGDLVQRKGWDVIPALLLAFGRGQNLAQVLPAVTGESLEEFGRRAMEVIRAKAESLAVWPLPDEERLNRLQARAGRGAGDRKLLEELALARYQQGDAEGTRRAAEKLLAEDPANPRALGLLGLVALRTHDESAAVNRLREAAAAGSRDVGVYLALGDLTTVSGDTAAALEAYARALAIYPGAVGARGKRAALLEAKGDTAAAREEYGKVLERSDSAGKAAVALARLDLAAARPQEALEVLDYALDVLPTDADVTALRGQAELLLGRDDDAYRLFLVARKLDLRSVESMVGMARYYLKKGDDEEAGYFARLALKYDPQHAVAKAVLATVEGR